ncbi:hypothetical protein HDU93_002915 [Gonapodya sp. JEL0774]|nr:hypothetical protein HDU93_002915 [Gonapodya sp. JEL0774]
MVAKDIHDHLHDKDKAYFRTSREQRLGRSLEEAVAERDSLIEPFRARLGPVRSTLAAGAPFLSGVKPGYPDFVLMGHFMWMRGTSPFFARLLEKDDLVALWRDRMLDYYGGLGRRAPGYD